jgi:hypothetical protein
MTSPDHQPRTLLMAAKTSSGAWSTANEVVKSSVFMIWFSTPFCCLRVLRGAQRF